MPLNRSIINQALYNRIRDIWFAGVPKGATVPPPEVMQRWFPRDPKTKEDFDQMCKQEFDSALTELGPGSNKEAVQLELVSDIEKQPDDLGYTNTALSIILLLDQISRNRFRTKDTLPLVYNHYDYLSISILRKILKRSPRPDQHPSLRYSSASRMWFYLPLMHSESRADHTTMLGLLDEFKSDLAGKDDKDCLNQLEMMTGMEERHKVIIDRFGRYPHRNNVLGRKPTEEEEKYLADGGETFGVAG